MASVRFSRREADRLERLFLLDRDRDARVMALALLDLRKLNNPHVRQRRAVWFDELMRLDLPPDCLPAGLPDVRPRDVLTAVLNDAGWDVVTPDSLTDLAAANVWMDSNGGADVCADLLRKATQGSLRGEAGRDGAEPGRVSPSRT